MSSNRSIRSSLNPRSRVRRPIRKIEEIERKARREQALLDANLRANAERLHAEQEIRRAEQRQAAIIQSLPILLCLSLFDANPTRPRFFSGDIEAITGFSYDEMKADPENLVGSAASRRSRPAYRGRLEARKQSREN